MYPQMAIDVSAELFLLEHQLNAFVMDLQSHPSLKEIDTLTDLVVKMAELKKSITYPLIFRRCVWN